MTLKLVSSTLVVVVALSVASCDSVVDSEEPAESQTDVHSATFDFSDLDFVVEHSEASHNETVAIPMDELTAAIVERGLTIAYLGSGPSDAIRWVPLPLTRTITTIDNATGMRTSESATVTFSIEPGVFRLYLSGPPEEDRDFVFQDARLRIVVVSTKTAASLPK